jgi:hypothetical protein
VNTVFNCAGAMGTAFWRMDGRQTQERAEEEAYNVY